MISGLGDAATGDPMPDKACFPVMPVLLRNGIRTNAVSSRLCLWRRVESANRTSSSHSPWSRQPARRDHAASWAWGYGQQEPAIVAAAVQLGEGTAFFRVKAHVHIGAVRAACTMKPLDHRPLASRELPTMQPAPVRWRWYRQSQSHRRGCRRTSDHPCRAPTPPVAYHWMPARRPSAPAGPPCGSIVASVAGLGPVSPYGVSEA